MLNSLPALVLLFIGGAFAVSYMFARGPGPHDTLRWVGLLLALAGLSGVILARWTLGKSFSIRPQARALVTRGIYSKIRNPIYLSGALMLAGFILITRMNRLWIVLALVVIVQMLRARRESKVLEAKFGEEYRKYRDRTWF